MYVLCALNFWFEFFQSFDFYFPLSSGSQYHNWIQEKSNSNWLEKF